MLQPSCYNYCYDQGCSAKVCGRVEPTLIFFNVLWDLVELGLEIHLVDLHEHEVDAVLHARLKGGKKC